MSRLRVFPPVLPSQHMHVSDPPQKVLLDPRTAPVSSSIWRDLPEDTFRTHLVQLEARTNGVPSAPQLCTFEATSEDDQHVLPMAVEKQLADDFAFLAAVEEGAQSVAACCIEELVGAAGIKVLFAITDCTYGPPREGLQSIFERLSSWATDACGLENSFRHHAVGLYHEIVQLHQQRIISRLRSKKWRKPKYLSESHKKPLCKDFENLTHRVQFLYTRKESIRKRVIEGKLQDLASIYEDFELTNATGFDSLKILVHKTFQLCISSEMEDFVHKLESVGVTAQVASALKCVRQIEKIGAYYRIPQSLMKTVEQYPSLFSNIHAEYLRPYSNIPASISFEAWARTIHVHAEVHLVAHYSIHNSGSNGRSVPRVIGTSKHMCFLCYLFIEKHGHFQVLNTHGRLYDQWTIPDLAEFDEERRKSFRSIIQEMDRVVVEWCRREPKWRAEPMTSRQNLVNGGMEVQELIELPFYRDDEERTTLGLQGSSDESRCEYVTREQHFTEVQA